MNRPTMERSVGMILIIPFGICFILLFLVCCFADEMKKMCILPSQIPPSYRSSSPVFNTSRRHESSSASSSRQNNRFDTEDIENQIMAVEQAETEQLIADDLIFTGTDVPVQINIRTNVIPNLHPLHNNTMNKNNNQNNNYHHQRTPSITSATTTTTNNNNDNNNSSSSTENCHTESFQQRTISRSSSSILLGNGVCINRPSLQHSDYVLSRHLGDISGVGIEEAETSLIPPIIFRSSLQQLQRPNNPENPDHPNILDQDPIAASDPISSHPVAGVSAKQRGINYPRQIQVSVSVNNLSSAHIHRPTNQLNMD